MKTMFFQRITIVAWEFRHKKVTGMQKLKNAQQWQAQFQLIRHMVAAVSSALWNLLKCEYLIMWDHGLIELVSCIAFLLLFAPLGHVLSTTVWNIFNAIEPVIYENGSLLHCRGFFSTFFRSRLCYRLGRCDFFVSHVRLILFQKLQSDTLIENAKNKHGSSVAIWLRVESVVGRMNGGSNCKTDCAWDTIQSIHDIETLFMPPPLESNNSQRQSIKATAPETDLCRMAFESRRSIVERRCFLIIDFVFTHKLYLLLSLLLYLMNFC